MSDETAPEATQDTPELETAQPETDWRKRYEDLQPDYTRKSQILTDEEQLLAHISEQFPHLMAEQADEDEDLSDDEDFRDDTPEPQPDPRIEQFETWMAQQQYEKDLGRFLGDRELSERGSKWVDAYSRANGHNAQSLEKAVEEWFALRDEFAPAEPEKAKKKTTPVPAGGQPATGVPDYSEMTEEQAVQEMVARARALDTQT